MAFSLTDFVQQLKKLEQLLAEDFQLLSVELRKKTAVSADDQVKFRLVEQLQYHDILRQKLEHVRHFGEQLMADHPNRGKENAKDAFDPGLLELSLALLRFTSMEYMEVSKKTHQLLFITDKNTNLIPETPAFEVEIQKLIRNLGNLYLEMDTSEGEEDEMENSNSPKYRKILDSFSMKTEREVFAMLFEGDSSTDEEENSEGEVELF